MLLIPGRNQHGQQREVGGVSGLWREPENFQIQQVVKDEEAEKPEHADMKNIHKGNRDVFTEGGGQ